MACGLRVRLVAGVCPGGGGAAVLRAGAQRQPAGRPGTVAQSLLGVVDAVDSAFGVERRARLGRRDAIPRHAVRARPAGVAALPPCGPQRAFRGRHHDLGAFAPAGRALRQRRAGTFRRHSLFDDLHFRTPRQLDRACVDVRADLLRVARGAVALSVDGRTVARCRDRGQPHPRNTAGLHRDSGAAHLYGHPLPLYGQNPRHAVAARGRRGLSGLRIHHRGSVRQGLAARSGEAAVRLVFRPFQPGRAASAGSLLDRRRPAGRRIRVHRAARVARGLRSVDDLLRVAFPFAAFGPLSLGVCCGILAFCAAGLCAGSPARAGGRAFAAAACYAGRREVAASRR